MGKGKGKGWPAKRGDDEQPVARDGKASRAAARAKWSEAAKAHDDEYTYTYSTSSSSVESGVSNDGEGCSSGSMDSVGYLDRSDVSEDDEELGTVLARVKGGLALARKRKRDALRRQRLGDSSDESGAGGWGSGSEGASSSDDERKSSQRPMKRQRTSRHGPVEMSAKTKPRGLPSRLRGGKKPVRARDPRFDSLVSGSTDHNLWYARYKHIREQQDVEMGQLRKSLKKERNPDARAELRDQLRKVQAMASNIDDRRAKARRNIERKRMEAALVAQGKNPYHLKNKDRKKLDLAIKFEELKKSGNLNKYVKRKRKKNLARDRKRMPSHANL
ncbi:uncharacterized protein AMSG_12093 [Thecamonas trahens ATCC 50062]|uniref:rRNA biogenesis protein RRP36 n=1 Tax=Thecamonas trahens ATCC 50062 TaxID=461836 RepID=A0A0L0DK09_THETB|nr:hypothetical protein AMSG_12093 [Thecamonas trahens ATCC 50062]KNC51658.1 hypothetical protein AMSG_12093 [Thecamonas trahens ATCC 50062]|eukprot:XP_013755894.1 hypothetical protein AMSG_12093 [Thecamonas trahens ATCC 50062]